MKDDIIFETPRIKFVKINEKYIQDYLNTVNDFETQKCITHNVRKFTLEDELNWVKVKQKEEALIFTMIEKDTDEFIGNIELKDVTDTKAELGICITRNKQDNHFGQEAIKGLLDYAFDVLGLTEIDLNVFDFNKRAQCCYEKVGFIADGVGKLENDIHMIYRKK